MRRLAVALSLVALAGCAGTDRGTAARTVSPTVTDLAVVRGLREIEDTVDRIITQIYSEAADEGRRNLAETLSHSHYRRVQRIKSFLEGNGGVGTASPTTVTASCFSADDRGRPFAPAEYLVLLNRVLAHHDCVQSQLTLLEKSDSSAVRGLAHDLARSYDEDRQLVQATKGF